MTVDHHALPSALENWLFPADGSTRDFETLQVILSSEDAFYASDRYGEIKSETSDFERKLRRATTINLASPAAENKRWVTNASLTPETERRRSSTLPSVTSVPDQVIGPPIRPQLKHIRSLSTDKPHRSSLMPSVARHRRMNWETRPRSHDELTTLKECPSPLPPEPSMESRRAQFSSSSHCSCGCHGGPGNTQSTSIPQRSVRPVYADASIQTDDSLLVQGDGEATYGQRPMNSTSSFVYEQNTQSQRTSFLSASTGAGSWTSDGSWCVPNPVVMGRMQDYFRSNNYLLGDSLQP